MICPFCHHPKTQVIQTTSFLPSEIPRARVCCGCGATFSTVETYDSFTKEILCAMTDTGRLDGIEKAIPETASIR